MNRTPNTTEKTNAQPVFNYAQAAKRSSQNLESQKPKPNTTTPAAAANESKSTEAEAAKVESPSSFAAALSKNAQATSPQPAPAAKSNRNASVQLPREPSTDAAPIQFGFVNTESKADDTKQATPETLTVTDNTSTRRDSTHSNTSGSEPHHYGNRHHGNRNQGKHSNNMHSPNMQPSYVPHHKKPMSPHMGSATSPNMNANQGGSWQNNQYYRPSQYYAPNSYPMPMPTYGGQAFVPQPSVNKAIPIINPNTSEVINLSSQSSSASKEAPAASPVAAHASPKVDEATKETKDFKINPTPSRAIKIVNPREKEEEAERKAKEEADKKAKEEAEQKAKEEAELKAKQEAEQKAKEEEERKAKEEAERKAKEEAAIKEKEQAEKKAKEEAEQKAKEEAELKAKQEAETKAAEEAKAEKKAKEEADAKAKQEADAQAAAEEAKAQESKTEEAKPASTEGTKEEERIAAITADKVARGVAPGRLDMSAIPAHVFHDSPVSTPTGVTPPKVKGPPMPVIEDFSSIDYPPEFLAPKARDPVSGKITYEPAFLMQFQKLCLETDEDLSQFQGMGEESSGNDNNRRGMSRRQTSDRGRGPRTPGGGSGDGMYRNNSRDGRGEMGKFSGGRQISHRQGSNGPNSPGMERQGSHGGRNRSGRGGKGRHPPREQVGAPTIPLDQVVPLEKGKNRWVPTVVATDGAAATVGEKAEAEAAEVVSQDIIIRKIKGLLNKLTLERFDSISDQIWEYAKQSEKEENGQSLRTVIQLIFDKACDEPNFASMWAQLCRKMYDVISLDNNIKDVNIVDKKNEPVSGGALYRKYLLNRCQQEFEKGWKSDLPKLDESSAEVMMTDEYYAAAKAKRQGLGLVQFIGELFKRQMLTDRVMIECLMRLCADPSHPEDEETETMCKMLTTMGKAFDTSGRKNKEWLDIYFERMNEMYKSTTLSSRVKFMILDVFDLRKSKWTLKRGNQPAPTTIAQIHEQAKKANEEKEKETMKRSGSSRGGNPMSRQSSRGGRDISRQNSSRNNNNNNSSSNASQDNQSGGNTPVASADGWNTVGTGSPTAGPRSGRTNELANFGKTDRGKSRGNVLGPASSPFSSLARSSSKTNIDKKATPTDSRASSPATSMANMFSALGGEDQEEEHSGERKKLQLLPRSGADNTSSEDSSEKKEESPAPAADEKPKLSDELIERRSKSTIEEYFSLRDKKELCECVKELDHTDYRVIFAGKLLDVVEKKTEDVDVVCDMIAELYKEKLMSREEYVAAFKKFWEGYEDLVIDVPKAPQHVDKLLAATGIERSEVECEAESF
ncbi:ribosomal protein S5 [Mucor velutinosus]|uniref:Ribosomal protein S5 n=1 Tax=Mucor velutinosus TaxID=708070 RepID=A0AAN7D6W7_9FUNG|nr:ribosomal protein S5 [Mucor velutinosus]